MACERATQQTGRRQNCWCRDRKIRLNASSNRDSRLDAILDTPRWRSAEKDPAGGVPSDFYLRELCGFDVHALPVNRAKTGALPASRRPGRAGQTAPRPLERPFPHRESFLTSDDQVDAFSGARTTLVDSNLAGVR
jgi:hypothetical protein